MFWAQSGVRRRGGKTNGPPRCRWKHETTRRRHPRLVGQNQVVGCSARYPKAPSRWMDGLWMARSSIPRPREKLDRCFEAARPIASSTRGVSRSSTLRRGKKTLTAPQTIQDKKDGRSKPISSPVMQRCITAAPGPPYLGLHPLADCVAEADGISSCVERGGGFVTAYGLGTPALYVLKVV